jgi:hypothetical protein
MTLRKMTPSETGKRLEGMGFNLITADDEQYYLFVTVDGKKIGIPRLEVLKDPEQALKTAISALKGVKTIERL